MQNIFNHMCTTTESKSCRHADVIQPHWRATEGLRRLSEQTQKFGVTQKWTAGGTKTKGSHRPCARECMSLNNVVYISNASQDLLVKLSWTDQKGFFCCFFKWTTSFFPTYIIMQHCQFIQFFFFKWNYSRAAWGHCFASRPLWPAAWGANLRPATLPPPGTH